jgi:hypothetical protein
MLMRGMVRLTQEIIADHAESERCVRGRVCKTIMYVVAQFYRRKVERGSTRIFVTVLGMLDLWCG